MTDSTSAVISSLKDTLDDDLPPHQRDSISDAIAFTHDEKDNLTLSTWLTTLRLLKDELSLRIDTGGAYFYFYFDTARNRPVLYDSVTDKHNPIEKIDIQSLFTHSTLTLVPHGDHTEKQYNKVTIILNDKKETQAVLGGTAESGQMITDSTTHEFERKLTIDLPKQMNEQEAIEWLEQSDIYHGIKRTHKQRWGENAQPEQE